MSQEAFKKHGVELTLEEVDSILVQAALSNGAEIDENALEQVSGGSSILVGTLLSQVG